MKKRELINGSYLALLFISTATIVLVQLASLLFVLLLMIQDIKARATESADEMSDLLAIPMYNVDDEQTIRIAESMLASGRLSGIRVTSTASGILVDTWNRQQTVWIKPVTRTVEYEGINLGELTFLFSDSDFVTFGRIYSLLSLVLLAAVLAALYLGSRFWIQRKIRRTFALLITGIDRIAAGFYDEPIPLSGYSDVDLIIGAMNGMAGKIIAKNRELQEINETLEARVADRTAELETSLVELRLMQDRLIEAGKLSALGQLSAGIAHEFNTPLGAIISAAGMLNEYFDTVMTDQLRQVAALEPPARELFFHVLESGLAANRSLYLPEYGRPEIRALASKLEESGVADGEEVADTLLELGLSEEVDALIPLLGSKDSGGVVSLASQAVVARRMGEIISESGKKATGVISALRSYLSSSPGDEPVPVDLAGDIRKVIALLHNLLKTGIEMETDFQGGYALGFSDRLSLVWMNLIRNAVQAMGFRGRLKIRTRNDGERVLVEVEDNGPGIPDELQTEIFKPFFTTRQHGEGMGLGLDICRKIVENHKGSLSVESRPGLTLFTVSLPAMIRE